MADNVNHPAHYEKSTSLECIDVMEIAFGYEAVTAFCMCNAFKYLWRYKNKNGKEDLDKARWYMKRVENYYLGHCDVPAAYNKKWETIMATLEIAEQEME